MEKRGECVRKGGGGAGEQAVVAVHPRSDKSGDSRLRSPKRQRLDAAPDETELAKVTADCPRNMTPHGQVRLQNFLMQLKKSNTLCSIIAIRAQINSTVSVHKKSP